MEVGVRLLLSVGLFCRFVSAQVGCSASFETACSVAMSYNLVVRMQMAFQSANESYFDEMAAEMNRGQGDFVQTAAKDLYGFIWLSNGTCIGHPFVCANGSTTMQEYVSRAGVITTPYLEKLIFATAYYAGGPLANETQASEIQGIGAWLFYYWNNELKRSFMLPVKPSWAQPLLGYYVGAGFNDVAAANASLVSPITCTPYSFALCASDLAQQLAQEFRLRLRRFYTQDQIYAFFEDITNHSESTRINGMFHADIYGILKTKSGTFATALAHSNDSVVGNDMVGSLRADEDLAVWERIQEAALGHKFGAWVAYAAETDDGVWVERFAYCLNVRVGEGLMTPYSSFLIVSHFDRVYDARASNSFLVMETPGIVWINREVVWLLYVGNERGYQQYEPDNEEKFIRTGINIVFSNGIISPITRQADGRFRFSIETNMTGEHTFNVFIQEKYQSQNITLMVPLSSKTMIVYDPANVLWLSDAMLWVFFGWTLFTAIMLVGFIWWTVVNRATRVVFASSADFMLLTAAGLLLTLVSVFINIIKQDYFTCHFQLSLWFQHLGSVLAETAMVVKAYRLHRIFNNRKLQKVVLPRVQLYGFVGIALGIQMVLLTVMTVVYEAELMPFSPQDVECVVSSDRGFLMMKCAMLCVEAIPVIGASLLAYKLQDIPMRYNESKWLGLACMNWAIVVFFYVVTFFAHLDVFLAQFFMCFCVVWVSFCTAILLFVPKIIQVKRSPAPLTKKSTQISVSSGLEAKLLPESILDTIKARENALNLAKAAQSRALAKLQATNETVKQCEAQLFDSVAELAFQNQDQNDAWKVIEGYQQIHARIRASINEPDDT